MTAPPDSAFAPSMWWVWILIGLIGLAGTVAGGALFGLSPLDVLLGREISLVLFLAFDYTLMGLGMWLALKAMLQRFARDAL